MNELVHFFTGYFLGRLYTKNSKNELSRRSHSSFIGFFAGMSGLVPDFDSMLGIRHGGFTHTIIGASILSVLFTCLVLIIGKDLIKSSKISLKELFTLGWFSTMLHLFLDIFTHQNFDPVGCSSLHLYFWPIWNQSFHLDCLFGWSYLVRVLIEWAIYVPSISIIILYRWIKRDENILELFNPNKWIENLQLDRTNVQTGNLNKRVKTESWLIWAISIIILGFMIVGYII